MPTFNIGDRVKLTGKFLRNTGQQLGSEGLSTWTVTGISGSFVITDEPGDISYFTADELAADPSLRFRRIHAGNLYKVGTLHIDNAL